MRLQHAHGDDALDRPRARIAGELLVAENGQTFLQAELEPVAARTAVARPVVEIFVRDYALDRGVVGVARGIRPGQNELVVEDVEALVLHRPHIEVADGDDVEHVEVVFAPEAFLVPSHCALERLHCPRAAVLLAGLDMDGESNLATRGGDETVTDGSQAATDEGKEVRWLGKGVVPNGEMPAGAGHVAMSHRVAVREQHGGRGLIRLDAHGVDREHIGAVDEIGDAAEALRLALRAVGAARKVEAGKGGVRLRIAKRNNLEGEGPRWHFGNGERSFRQLIVSWWERLAVEHNALELQGLAVEHTRPAAGCD